MSLRFLATGALTAAVLLSACSGGSESSDVDPGAATQGARYVAIGDSFVSGPLIDPADPDEPACLRSKRNYPALLAEALGETSVKDVSCAGETTSTLTMGRTLPGGTVVRSQLDAVTPSARLVTVGIGANDEAATAGLFTYCLVTATATDDACQKFATTLMPEAYPTIRENVVEVLSKVKERAPRAKVLLTGYLRISPSSGSCADLPVTSVTRRGSLAWEKGINEVLADAAREADVTFVDVRGVSEGHDACAGDGQKWVNGLTAAPGDGSAAHPTEAGMEQVAQQVLQAAGGA